jgi:hypothetical protein
MFKDEDLVAAIGYKFRKEQIVIVSGKQRKIPCDGDSFGCDRKRNATNLLL